MTYQYYFFKNTAFNNHRFWSPKDDQEATLKEKGRASNGQSFEGHDYQVRDSLPHSQLP